MTSSRVSTPDLERLTGVRSGKGTFYPEFRVAAQRTERVVAALEAISRALVQTTHGPEPLVRESPRRRAPTSAPTGCYWRSPMGRCRKRDRGT